MALKVVAPLLQPVRALLRVPPKVADSFYRSREWRALAASIKRERGPVCSACGARGGRIIPDHITELKDGGEPLDRSNIQLLCMACHNAKTARAKAARAQGS